MDVHVYRRSGDLQVQHTGGEFAHHQLVPVGLLQSGDEQLGFDRPVIDEEGLQVPAGPGIGRLGDEAGEFVFFPLALHRHHPGGFPAVDAVDGGLQAAGTRGGQQKLPVPDQLDGAARVGQGLELDGGGHTGPLYRVCLHEFHSGGGIVEQVANDDGGAVRASGLRLLGDFASLQVEADTSEILGWLGHQVHPADGGDGGQSFPSEPHGANDCQVLCRAQLRGGMAEKRPSGILGSHAAAVVRHSQEGHAAVADLNGDLGGSRVHGVFQQLLGHGGRPLHDFTGGNQIGNMGGKLNDLWHSITSKGSGCRD